jgi:dTDP-4-dehydrorhamnose 3,5-epimerase
MKIVPTKIPEVKIIQPDVHQDDRGSFSESYNKRDFESRGIKANFVQDNQSFSRRKGVLRGLHFQENPMAQAKLVRCTSGAILDVAVDLRHGSPTYKQWISTELSADNQKQLFIPRGFAHGYLTLTDNVCFQYKVDQYYSKKHDRSIRYNDPEIGIDWGGIKPILSDKDQNAPLLQDCKINFL